MLLRKSCLFGTVACLFMQIHGGAFTTSSKQNCDAPLTYTKQYCSVKYSEWECLHHRALLQDRDMCKKWKGPSFLSEVCWDDGPCNATCTYVEICMFSVPEEVDGMCSGELDAMMDKCSGGDNGTNLTCTIKGVEFQTPCHRSLVYCPTSVCIPEFFISALFEHKVCFEEYEGVLGNKTSWALVNRAIFNGQMYNYSPVTIFRQFQCSVQQQKKSFRWEWILALPLFIVSIVVILFYLRKRWRMYMDFPEPSECSSDAIAREMAKAFAVGDSMIVEPTAVTTEIPEPLSADGIATLNLSGPTGNTENMAICNGSAAHGTLVTGKNATTIPHPSESQLLHFISNGPSIAVDSSLLELGLANEATCDQKTRTGDVSVTGDQFLDNAPMRSPFLSTTSSGSGFDASRPGGLGTIVPGSTRNRYTNVTGDQEFPAMSQSTGSTQNDVIYQNTAENTHPPSTKPSGPRQYMNDSMDAKEETLSLSGDPEPVANCGYLEKHCDKTDYENVERMTSLLPYDPDLLGKCDEHTYMNKESTEQRGIHLCNPSYVNLGQNNDSDEEGANRFKNSNRS